MHFICLVVVLWIVFENLGLLLVVEVADEIVEAKFRAPFLAVDEPVFALVYACMMGVRKRTSSLRAPHRTCGLAEIAAINTVSLVIEFLRI